MTTSPPDEPLRIPFGVLLLAIAIAGILAYANSFRNDFVWDDASSVLIHRNVQDPAKIAQLFREDQHAFGQGQGNFYRPLVSVSFMLDYQLGTGFGAYEPKPFVFHLTNLFWHLAASIGLLALLRALGAPWFVLAAVPVLFVVHPLHTEAVTYISGRADPMAAAFMYAGLALALVCGASLRGVAAGVASLVCFVAALLCKESAMIFPALLFLTLLAARGMSGPRRAGWVVFAGSLAVLGVYGWLRATVLNFVSDSVVPDTTLLGRLNEVVQAFGTYVRLVFWPANLHMERTLDGYTWLHSLIGAVVLVVVVAVLVVAIVRRWTPIGFGLAWFFVSWLPISGIFPLNAPLAEHWLYVPLAGLLVALAGAASLRASDRTLTRIGLAGVAFATLALMAPTLSRNEDWLDNATLFRATLDDNPKSTRVHYNLAVTYEDLLGNLPGARRHYEQVLALYAAKKPESDKATYWGEELGAHLSLGNIYLEQRRYDLAGPHYEVLTKLVESDAYRAMMGAASLGLAQCQIAVGDPKAMESIQKAIALQPELRSEAARILRDVS